MEKKLPWIHSGCLHINLSQSNLLWKKNFLDLIGHQHLRPVAVQPSVEKKRYLCNLTSRVLIRRSPTFCGKKTYTLANILHEQGQSQSNLLWKKNVAEVDQEQADKIVAVQPSVEKKL